MRKAPGRGAEDPWERTTGPFEVIRASRTDPRVLASFEQLLRSHRVAAFATVGPASRAHVHVAYFAWSAEHDLFFYSWPASRHARHLEANPSMAVALFDAHQRWGDPKRGGQLYGTAHEARGRWAEVARTVYAKRFPGFDRARKEDGGPSPTPYRFRARCARWFDSRLGGPPGLLEVTWPRRANGRARASATIPSPK